MSRPDVFVFLADDHVHDGKTMMRDFLNNNGILLQAPQNQDMPNDPPPLPGNDDGSTDG
jgi:hypothetical protein